MWTGWGVFIFLYFFLVCPCCSGKLPYWKTNEPYYMAHILYGPYIICQIYAAYNMPYHVGTYITFILLTYIIWAITYGSYDMTHIIK